MTTRGGASRLLWALTLAVLLAAGSASAAAGSTAGRVFLQTVPALPGVHLLVDGRTVTTGPDGSAAVAVADLNGVASRVRLAGPDQGARTTVALARVQPSPHTVPNESHLTIGLDVTSRVRLAVTGGSSGVAARSVQQVRLHSVTGQRLSVDPGRTATVDLLSRKIRLRAGRVVAQVVTWSVDSVHALPGVAVRTASQRFDPFTAAQWPLRLEPVAGTAVVDTMPRTAGVSFVIDGTSFTTDRHGHATAPIVDLNGVDSRLQLSTPRAGSSTVSVARVARLAPAAPFQRHLMVALAVSRPVSLTFTAPDGKAVPVGRVTGVQLTGGADSVQVGRAQLGRPVPLLASVGKLVGGVWTPEPVTYAVAGVAIEGADAVFAGQQRFRPVDAATWPIAVSVFDVSVTARDVLFGSRLRSTAYVSRPDGVRSPVQLDSGGPTMLRSLVRGEYTVTTAAALLGGSTTILVSKSSDVEIRVVTLPDAIVVALLLIGAALSLVLVGRRVGRRSRSNGAVS